MTPLMSHDQVTLANIKQQVLHFHDKSLTCTHILKEGSNENITYAVFSEIDIDTKEHETLSTRMLSTNQLINPAWNFHTNDDIKIQVHKLTLVQLYKIPSQNNIIINLIRTKNK